MNKTSNTQYEIPSLKIEYGDEISLDYIKNDMFNMSIKYGLLETVLKTLSLEDYKFVHNKWMMQFAYDIVYNNMVNFNPNNKKLIQKYDICNHLLFTEIYDNFYEIIDQVEDTLSQIAPMYQKMKKIMECLTIWMINYFNQNLLILKNNLV